MPLKEKILFSDSDKEKGDKESFLTALIDRDWSAVLKPALEKHNFQIVKKLHKENRWDDIPEICKTCPDWQVAGATYHENKNIELKKEARPFWWKEENNED